MPAGRVPPIPPEQWSAEIAASFAPLSPKDRRHAPPPTDERSGGMRALGLMAHHPALARAFLTFNGHVLWDTTLTPRQRQLLILRVSSRRGSSFVWSEHSRISLHAGLSEDDVARVAEGPDAPGWEPLEAALLRAVDELIDDGILSDPTWATLSAALELEQVVDVIFTVGCYETTSWYFRSFGLEAEA
jgi:alkylhydroperoxidase family enzyme